MFKNRDNLILVGIFFFLTGVYIFVFSESGVLERIKFDEKRSEIISRIESLKEDNRKLEAASGGSGSDRISDEDLARYGYIKKGSKLIFNKISPERTAEKFPSGGDDERGGIEISHLRIIWIVISSLIVLLLIGSRYKKRD